MLNCHCRDCQRSSGGPFSSFVVVPTEAFKLVKGELRFHASPSEMGGMTRRGFCSECGSPVMGKPDMVAHTVAIRAGSMDDPGGFAPQMEVWASDAQVWDRLDAGLARFEKYPQ